MGSSGSWIESAIRGGKETGARPGRLIRGVGSGLLSTPLPGASWSRNASAGNNRLFLPDFGTDIPPEAPPGVATSLDLLPEIEGDEYQLTAQVLSASFLGLGTQGPIAIAEVARGTTMRWDAGSLIHRVRSPAGTEFVLLSISEIHTGIFDPFVLNGLAAMSLPPGWAYESEVLATDFTIGTPTGIASVYSVPNYWAWQEVIPVPEPSTGVLLGLGLAGLASGRRRPWFGTTVNERRFLLREGPRMAIPDADPPANHGA